MLYLDVFLQHVVSTVKRKRINSGDALSKIRFCKGARAFCSKRKVGPFFRKRFIDKDNACLLEKSLNADVGYRVFRSVSQSPNNFFPKIQRLYMPQVRFYTFWGRSDVRNVQFGLRPYNF